MPKALNPKAEDVISVLRNMGYKVVEAKRRCESAMAALGPDAGLEELIKSALKAAAPKIPAVVEAEPEEEPEEPARPIKASKPVIKRASKRPRGRPEEEVEEGEEPKASLVYPVLVILGAGLLTGLFFLGVVKGLAAILLFGALLYRMGTRITRPGAMRH